MLVSYSNTAMPASITNNSSKQAKRKRFLTNKPLKKGSSSLRPGVQGFFITCDGGKERKASYEAMNVIDSFYEAIVGQRHPDLAHDETHEVPVNNKTKFTYSDSSSEDENNGESDEDKEGGIIHKANNGCIGEKGGNSVCNDGSVVNETQREQKNDDNGNKHESDTVKLPQAKRQCLQTSTTYTEVSDQPAERSVDKLIEAEIQELGDRNMRRIIRLDSGCNGVAFVQMCAREGDPSPTDIVHKLMTSAASSRKHISRYILRLLPMEVSCYASEEDICRAIKPIISKYFPSDTDIPYKFAVLYDARANTGIEREKIIDVVAKSVPPPHMVNLGNPDKTIVVQIVKTVCLIGVVERYKELGKYNLRQLNSCKK